ncbi:MAG: alpha-2-macroglobulin family protein, partial [Planctomycetaceae bacterium]
DLPAPIEYREQVHDFPVPQNLPPGEWWVLASHKDDFSDLDNVVSGALVWTSRLAIVTRQDHRSDGPLSGHVVDVASGEPVGKATLHPFVRDPQGQRFKRFNRGRPVRTDDEGRYELPAEPGRETVILAEAVIEGAKHRMGSDPTVIWHHGRGEESHRQIVLMIDRGVHRPGQTVFYKGILCSIKASNGDYRTLPDRNAIVTFRDANGREIARREQKTNAFGSFSGQFSIPPSGLPGQWALSAESEGAHGGSAVRVEEYKRPKFRVTLEPIDGKIVLGGDVTLSGRAETYTGLPVSGARVRWRVERTSRFAPWCRWFFPWLPFDGGGQRIARGSAETDADGQVRVTFPAAPDRSVPPDSLPIFSYEVVADVTDPSGETRSAERNLNAGYTDIEASISSDDWQAVAADGVVETVLTVLTSSLDGEPLSAEGTLSVHRVVQPPEVDRGDIIGGRPGPRRLAGERPLPPKPDPSQPETWAQGELVVSRKAVTDAATGKMSATARLEAGLYRATFEIPARGEIPAIRATRIVEVIDPASARYGVRRPFILRASRTSVEPGESFKALVGTGYGDGRSFVEVLQAGRVLSRRWTEPGRTQWPVEVDVGEDLRGGFTVRAWMVRDGRLHMESLPVNVPWTNKTFTIEWERFTRRLEPAAHEVWRARIRGSDAALKKDPSAAPAVVAEMAATLYDQSLDAIAPHAWPAGLDGFLRREWSGVQQGFTNGGATLGRFLGEWRHGYEARAITYRSFIDPFGTPNGGGLMNRRGRLFAQEMAGGLRMAPAMAAMDAAAPMEKSQATNGLGLADEQAKDKRTGDGDHAVDASVDSSPPPRRNLAETAFFLPSLTTEADGDVTIEFTLPDTLTTWQFKAIAHDTGMRSGSLTDTCVAAKDLMVEPVMPRFVREGDSLEIPVKVGNRSTGRLTGTVRFALADSRTGDRRDDLLDGPTEQAFDLGAGESKPLVFKVRVTGGSDVLTYLATGSPGRLTDGEEGLLPVLPRKVLVSESVPVTIRGPGSTEAVLERLAKPTDSMQNQSLVVQASSNPAWYAVMAMPSIMEEADEGVDTLFNRLYVNALAREHVARDDRIGRTFEQWRLAAARPEARGRKPLESPLESNTSLMQTILAETPWVRESASESESRARIATFFDATRTANETAAAIVRLQSLRNGDGGWPWFPGGRSCDSVTLSIIAGFGRLRTHGVAIDLQPALAAIPWIDGRLVDEEANGRKLAEEIDKQGRGKVVLTPIGVFALYARSCFLEDAPPDGRVAEAIRWCVGVGKKSWSELANRRSQGQLAIALSRLGEKPTATSVIESLRQRATGAEIEQGEESANWQGMWWRDPHPAWWSWLDSPIETQAILIEAFDEVAGDAASVEAMKAWLNSQKRSSRWRGSRATADAVAVLLGRGEDLLVDKRPLDVTIGGEPVKPEAVEAGTGFFETRLARGEIGSEQSTIRFTKPDAGIAFGGVHWQYLDDIERVDAASREELAIEKRLFVKRSTRKGPVLEPVENADDQAAAGRTRIELGDEIVVRLVTTSDRDYEFLELTDHRPSLTEPVDSLSGWRWRDGVGWYAAVRDTNMQFFFERIPRGTHVLEYSIRAAHRGTASSGFARIQSRYAPEFSARSASVPVEVN